MWELWACAESLFGLCRKLGAAALAGVGLAFGFVAEEAVAILVECTAVLAPPPLRRSGRRRREAAEEARRAAESGKCLECEARARALSVFGLGRNLGGGGDGRGELGSWLCDKRSGGPAAVLVECPAVLAPLPLRWSETRRSGGAEGSRRGGEKKRRRGGEKERRRGGERLRSKKDRS